MSASVGQGDVVLKAQFLDKTFGDIVAYLVGLATHEPDYRLDTPWDVLNEIKLDNLILEYNLTKKKVGFQYKLEKNLIFIHLKSFELWFSRAEGKSVDLSIVGSFLGKQYPEDRPLSWDLLSESPPAVPGKGASSFDLEYLGIGQHVTLQSTRDLHSVSDVIAALENTVIPLSDAKKNPLAQLPGLKFDGASSWLIGTKFTVMETVTLAAVFNDPELYGLLVSLSGPKAKAFGGLSFEILYKKVTDSIGVYSLQLKLPDVMRHLEFGEVSVTLPVIGVDIFTNGNFRVDLGFPKNALDFSASFALEMFPFVGVGGFYFGLLDGATSRTVPKIDNGRFAPVIEFGFALQAGVGKDIHAGPLSAGLVIAVEGILEGTLGWFEPDDRSIEKAQYYALQGTIAIVGKLYGTVDFAIIKASVSVMVYATARITMEAYEPIEFVLSAGVRVRVSIKIVFVRVHFSFSATITEKFTIGSRSATPWNVIEAPERPRRVTAKGMRALPSMASLEAVLAESPSLSSRLALLEIVPELPGPAALTWDSSFEVWSDGSRMLRLYAVPSVTKATTEEQCAICNGGPDAPPNPPKVVTLLFIENPGTEADSADAGARADRGSNGEADRGAGDDFTTLARAMLAWAIHAGVPTPDGPPTDTGLDGEVRSQDLEKIYQLLTDEETAARSQFTSSELFAFLRNNFTFEIGSEAPTKNDVSGSVFPIFPQLTLSTSDGKIRRPLREWPMALDGDNYEKLIDRCFDEMAVAYRRLTEGPSATEAQLKTAASAPVMSSVPELVFKDYFLMVVRGVLQSALTRLRQFPYRVKGDETLQAIVDSMRPVSDPSQDAPTVASVALANVANAKILRAGGAWSLTGVSYHIRSGDTLSAITAKFAAVPLVTLAELARCNRHTSLFKPGTTLEVKDLEYTVPSATTLASLTDLFGVNEEDIGLRKGSVGVGDVIPPRTELAVNNRTITGDSVKGKTLGAITRERGVPLEALTALNPKLSASATLNGDASVTIPTITYDASPTDAVERMAFRFRVDADTVRAMNDLPADMAELPDKRLWLPDLVFTVPPSDTDTILAYFGVSLEHLVADNPLVNLGNALEPGTTLAMTAVRHEVRPDDTLASVAYYYGAAIEKLALDNDELELAPLVPLTVPDFTHHAGEGETLGDIAARYDVPAAQLAEANAGSAGLLQQGQVLTLPQVSQIRIRDLLDGLADAGEFSTVGAMVSRFLLHGLRLPTPDAETLQTPLDQIDYLALAKCPLYCLTGQQFNAPAEDGVAIELSLAAADQRWILFTDGAATLSVPIDVEEVKAFAGLDLVLHVEPPQGMRRYQQWPARFTLRHKTVWQAATVLPNGSGDKGDTPATGNPTIWALPQSLTRALVDDGHAEAPVALCVGRHEGSGNGLTTSPIQRYWWATTVKVRVRREASEGGSQPPVSSYVVEGVDELGRQLLEMVYGDLNGSDGDAKVELHILYPPDATGSAPQGLKSDHVSNPDPLLVKTNLSTLSHKPLGVTALARDVAEMTPSDAAPYAAMLGQPREFVKLLWECSVVNSGGYYLQYALEGGEQGLPDYLFSEAEHADLTLLIRMIAGKGPVRSFYNAVVIGDNVDMSDAVLFVEAETITVGTNATLDVMVGEGQKKRPGLQLDQLAEANRGVVGLLAVGAQMKLQAQGPETYTIQAGDSFASIAQAKGVDVAHLATWNHDQAGLLRPGVLMDLYPGMLRKTATLPPGHVGFELARPDPTPRGSAQETPAVKLQLLYNLLSYGIVSGGGFEASPAGLPVGPTEPETDTEGDASASAPSEPAAWNYGHVIPAFRFAETRREVARLAGESGPAWLPPASDDPYAPVGLTAAVQFQFLDIFGNRLDPKDPPKNLGLPCNYSDNLIALAQWPGVHPVYDIEAGPATAAGDSGGTREAHLSVAVSLDVTKYAPGPGNELSRCVRKALADQSTYARIYYQLRQPDVALHIETTLNRDGSTTIAKDPFVQFVGAAYAYLAVTRSLEPHRHSVATNDSFRSVAKQFHMAPAAVGEVNRDVVRPFEAQTIRIPEYHVLAAGETLDSLVSEEVPAVTLVTENASVPDLLRPGAVIVLPGQGHKVDPGPDHTLRAIAKLSGVPIPDLAVVNQTVKLSDGQTLDIDAETPAYTVREGDTLTSVAVKHGTSVPALAALNDSVQPLFALNETLTIPHTYVVQRRDTFRSVAIQTRMQFEDLAAKIGDDPGVLQTGARLFVRTVEHTLGADELTLADVALKATHASGVDVSVADIVSHNLDAKLNRQLDNPSLGTTGALTVPYVVTLDPKDDLAAAPSVYTVAPRDTLATIATGGRQVGELGLANRYTRSLVREGANITIPLPHTVTQGQTLRDLTRLASLADDLTVDVGELGQCNADLTHLLRPGAEVAVPGNDRVAVQPGDTLASIGAHRITARQVAELNQDSPGLLLAGAAVIVPVSATVRPNETLATVAARLPGVTVPALAVANQLQEGLLREGAVMLLPPAPVTVRAGIGGEPYPGHIFPVEVALEIARTRHIDPDFGDVPSVRAVTSAIDPKTAPTTGARQGVHSLVAFARDFEEALPNLKLATGEPKRRPRPSREGPGVTRATATVRGAAGNGPAGRRDSKTLWAVWLRDDTRTAIPQADVPPNGQPLTYRIQTDQPRFFGLPPLSTGLVTRDDVQVPEYQSGEEFSAASFTTLSFTNVDMDAWAREFLAAVDQFLQPESAVAACQVAPSAFKSVMDGKQTMAAAVATGVTHMLQDSPPPDRGSVASPADAAVEEAREALKQRVLIELSAAYKTDAIVQYPVTVQSPETASRRTAPRLSGRPQPQLYRVRWGDTLTSIAQSFSVSVDVRDFAHVIKDVKGMYAAGSKLFLDSSTYLIRDRDSLCDIARALAHTPECRPDMLDKVIALTRDTPGYLRPGFVLRLTSFVYSTGEEGASLTEVAERFGADVGTVAVANQRRQMILNATSLTVDGQEIRISRRDALADVARQCHRSVAQLAEVIADHVNLFAGSTDLLVPVFLPELTLSTAKVPLAEGMSSLTFLVSTTVPAQQKSLSVQLDYHVNELEFDIGDVPGIEGYQSSSWLSFVRPMRVEVPWPVTIPVPLRSYPTPPALLRQMAHYNTGEDLAAAMSWRYEFTYEHSGAAQDAVRVGYDYNRGQQRAGRVGAALMTTGIPEPKDLFEALAWFHHVYPALSADLARLRLKRAGDAAEGDRSLQGAVEMFARVVRGAAATWEAWWAQPDELLAMVERRASHRAYHFRVRERRRPDGALHVTLASLPGDGEATKLPEVAVGGHARDRMLMPRGAERHRTVTDPEARQVLEFQNAWGWVQLLRNEELLSGQHTNPRFVYTTPTVRFKDALTPLIRDETRYVIPELPQSRGGRPNEKPVRQSLEQHLRALVWTLIPKTVSAPFAMKVACSYGYILAAGPAQRRGRRAARALLATANVEEAGQALVTTLPVVLVPHFVFSRGDTDPRVTDLVSTLTSAITRWADGNHPSLDGGAYVFEVGFFSDPDLDPHGPRMLAQLNNLELGLEWIVPPQSTPAAR